MEITASPLLDDDSRFRLKIARILLEGLLDDFRQLERGADAELRDCVADIMTLAALALDELPRSK